MPFVRTVLGDVEPSTLGVVLAHEHLIIDSPTVEKRWPEIHLPSTAEAVAEIGECLVAGVETMVDAMPIGSGGDPVRLREISLATGLNIVAATGMHTTKYYEALDWALSGSVGDLTRRFTDSIANDVAGARTGILKVATAGAVLSPLELRLFEAAAMTHFESGVPLLTHCEGGRGGMAQVEMLSSLGVSLSKVVLSHTDKVADMAYHHDMLATGVGLCYDQGLRSPDTTANLITEMTSLGFGSQLTIGTDGARRSLWSTLGGSPGVAWIRGGFREVLLARGLDRTQLQQLFVSNPARWLTFSE